MELRPSYKQTEIGILPVDWNVAFLDDFARRGSGHTPDKKHPEYWNGSIHWISLADSPALDRLYIESTFASITPAGIANSSAVAHPAGTVVLSRDAGVGKSAIMRRDMAVSQHFMAWRCGPHLDNRFLYYWLQASKPDFERIANGSTIKTIGVPFFRDYKIALPPLAEQRAVATALSDADALLDALTRLIAKKRDLKQAAMQQLLTGRIRLPGFQGEWEMTALGDLGSTYSGLSGKTKSDFGRGDGRYVTFMNVMTNVIIDDSMFEPVRVGPMESQNRLSRGDLLFNGSSETPEEIAMCSVLRSDAKNLFLNSFCFGFRLNDSAKSDALFLAYYLRSSVGREIVKSLAQGSTRYNVSKAALLKAAIPLPSSREQGAIAAVLTAMDAEITALEARRDKTRALKQAMMQELLTGRTRLV